MDRMVGRLLRPFRPDVMAEETRVVGKEEGSESHLVNGEGCGVTGGTREMSICGARVKITFECGIFLDKKLCRNNP